MAIPDSSSSATMLAGNSTPAWRSSEKLTGLPTAVRKALSTSACCSSGRDKPPGDANYGGRSDYAPLRYTHMGI